MENTEHSRISEYLTILGSLSYVIIMIGAIMLLPLVLILFYKDEADQLPYFALPGVLSIFAGYLIKQFSPNHSLKDLRRHQSSVIVLLIWIVSILIGSIPFMLCGDYTFTEAIFETTSGFTTTGFTVTDVENTTHVILLYRSLLHLFGGVGLILILSSVLSNVYGMQLFSAEGHRDRLTPSLLHSARTIILIYLGFIISGTILYIVFGMSPFDALNHAICAVSTGGFSTKYQSIGYWSASLVGVANSIGIKITTIALMLLGSINFMASLLFFRGKFRDYFSHSETKVTAFAIAIATPIVVVMLLATGLCNTTLSAISDGIFQVVSLITTTGYTTVPNFVAQSSFAFVPIFLLMLIGGHSGSTSGGIKASRVAMLIKAVFYDVCEQIFPKRISFSRSINKFGKKVQITREDQSQNYAYVFTFIFIGLFGAFLLSLDGHDFGQAFFDAFSTLSTIGLSIGTVTREMSNYTMWVYTALMIIGRLEVYIVILAIARIGKDIGDGIKELRSK